MSYDPNQSQQPYGYQPQPNQQPPSQYSPEQQYEQQQFYGQQQYGQPQYGQPQYGQPQYGQPQYGAPPVFNYVQSQQKDWLTALILCIFLGGLGVHRFYTGHIAIGVIQLLTVGGCGIWWLIDLILIVTDSYKDSNGLPLLKR